MFDLQFDTKWENPRNKYYVSYKKKKEEITVSAEKDDFFFLI